MRYLKQNTATRVTVGPFLDKDDGITPEITLTVTSCLLTLCVDDAGVPTLVIDAAPTASGGDNDMVHVTSDAAGFYDLELTAAQTNYVGRAILSITDAAVHCPVFHEFTILPANVYDSLLGADLLDVNTAQWLGTACATPTTNGVPEVDVTFVNGSAASGSGTIDANVVSISGDTGAADNLEAAFDGTGYNEPYYRGVVGTTHTTTSITSSTAALQALANDFLNTWSMRFTSGALTGYVIASITDFAGTTATFTVPDTGTACAEGDTFIVYKA